LQAQKSIQAVYTHDDDMAQGVVAAIKEAGREKGLFVTGAGGSKQAMDAIKAGGVYRATFLYNPIMSASAISIARLIAQDAGSTVRLPKDRASAPVVAHDGGDPSAAGAVGVPPSNVPEGTSAAVSPGAAGVAPDPESLAPQGKGVVRLGFFISDDASAIYKSL